MTITSSWEYTERLDLMDTLDGDTHVAITEWVTTTPMTDELMHRTSRNFTRVVQRYLK